MLCEKTKKKNVRHCFSEMYQKSARTNENNQRYGIITMVRQDFTPGWDDDCSCLRPRPTDGICQDIDIYVQSCQHFKKWCLS